MTTPNDNLPPHYIILTQSQLSPSSSTRAEPTAQTLVHPIIHYHYADDPPLSLLPTNPNQSYIILDVDPADPSQTPIVNSISEDMVVVGVKVNDAPGAEGDRNARMYTIETMLGATPDASR